MDGFKPFDFSCGVPTLSVTENGATFDKNTTHALDYAEYVKVYLNKEKKLLFVCKGKLGDAGAMKYYRPGKKTKNVRTNMRFFVSSLENLVGTKAEYGVKVYGSIVDDGVLFDFNNARLIK